MRIHLAGAESLGAAVACASTGKVKNVLWSFFKFSKFKDKDKTKDKPGATSEAVQVVQLYKENDWNVILDSGLFSLLFGAASGTDVTLPFLRKYVERYLEFCKACRYDSYIVECDAQMIIGSAGVWKLREKYFEKWKHNKVIYVWHLPEKIKGLEKMVERYDYIAISVPELRVLAKHNKVPLKTLCAKMVEHVLSRNPKCKIHLLGNTDTKCLEFHDVLSCDSTSWYTSSIWNAGKACFFDGRKVVFFKAGPEQVDKMVDGAQREKLEAYRKRYDRQLSTDKYMMCGIAGANAYALYEQYLNKRFRGMECNTENG